MIGSWVLFGQGFCRGWGQDPWTMQPDSRESTANASFRTVCGGQTVRWRECGRYATLRPSLDRAESLLEQYDRLERQIVARANVAMDYGLDGPKANPKGRPSIPQEQLLKSRLLIALYSVRSERLYCEQLAYNPVSRKR